MNTLRQYLSLTATLLISGLLALLPCSCIGEEEFDNTPTGNFEAL